mmetsp:Transcript_22390/g.55171  ORF Transcript_22390/g.55171 Transcript_22390/m.55171 type:complete len:167 (+) Transcript_22390:98-598(+)
MAAELIAAAEAGDLGRVRELVAAGSDVSKANEDGWSPLIMASKGGHNDVVKLLLESKAAPNPDCVAHTALRAASIYGHTETLRILLAAGGDPNFVSLHDRTPLMGAAMGGHAECAKILLEAGADANAKNDVGESAADLANIKGHKGVVELLQLASASSDVASGSRS